MIPEGAEAEALAKLPIAALGLDEEHAGTFALWGIGTLGELAALPEAELVARMGPRGAPMAGAGARHGGTCFRADRAGVFARRVLRV